MAVDEWADKAGRIREMGTWRRRVVVAAVSVLASQCRWLPKHASIVVCFSNRVEEWRKRGSEVGVRTF